MTRKHKETIWSLSQSVSEKLTDRTEVDITAKLLCKIFEYYLHLKKKLLSMMHSDTLTEGQKHKSFHVNLTCSQHVKTVRFSLVINEPWIFTVIVLLWKVQKWSCELSTNSVSVFKRTVQLQPSPPACSCRFQQKTDSALTRIEPRDRELKNLSAEDMFSAHFTKQRPADYNNT